MIKLISRTAAIAIAAALFAGSASAETPTTAATTKAAPAKTAAVDKKDDAPRTAASLECSKQADAKNLHGKERRKFRSDCKKTEAKPN